MRSQVPPPPHAAPPKGAPGKSAPLRKEGDLVGRIEVPRLKLSAIVLEGSDSKTLSLGVGRIPETSEPGEPGNVVLGGHRDTFFRPLSGIREGDAIRLVTAEGSYRYSVDWTTVVDPEDNAVLKPTPQPSLTLVTCYPFHYVGPAPRRFIVRAHQELEPEAAPPAEATKQAPPPAIDRHVPSPHRHIARARLQKARLASPPARGVETGRSKRNVSSYRPSRWLRRHLRLH
ncbi:MAG: class D sortase [Candidatus Solibacter sp.]